jgi:hypothetical protein
MVYAIRNQDKRLTDSRLSGRKADLVRRSSPPRIILAVDEGYARVAEVPAAELVDGFDVGWRGDVELLAARDCAIFYVDEA